MPSPFSHNHARGDQVLYRAPFRSRGRRPWLAAEVLGVGQKASDLLTVPLCRPCHQRVTDTGSLPGLDRDGTLLRVVTAQRDLLARWVARALQDRAAEAAAAIPVPLLARRAS